jgi:hypothetical protein
LLKKTDNMSELDAKMIILRKLQLKQIFFCLMSAIVKYCLLSTINCSFVFREAQISVAWRGVNPRGATVATIWAQT